MILKRYRCIIKIVTEKHYPISGLIITSCMEFSCIIFLIFVFSVAIHYLLQSWILSIRHLGTLFKGLENIFEKHLQDIVDFVEASMSDELHIFAILSCVHVFLQLWVCDDGCGGVKFWCRAGDKPLPEPMMTQFVGSRSANRSRGMPSPFVNKFIW